MSSITMSQAKKTTADASAELTSWGGEVMRLRPEAEIARINTVYAQEAYDQMQATFEKMKETLNMAKTLVEQTQSKADDINAQLLFAEGEAACFDNALRKAQAVEAHLVQMATKSVRSKIEALCSEVLDSSTTISVESLGDKWTGTVVPEGFLVNGTLYTSPHALGKAHASRITDNHPQPTKPGSGWAYIMVESGKHKGRSIKEAFDAHFNTSGPW
jgi:hypothetical protein